MKKKYLKPETKVIVPTESLCTLVTLSATNSGSGHEGFEGYNSGESEGEGFGNTASDPDLTWN
jgi:hypothetical protein